MPDALYGVGVEKDPLFPESFADLFRRLERADLVLRAHQGHEPRVGRKRGKNPFGIVKAVPAGIEKDDPEAGRPELFQGLEDRGVLDPSRGDASLFRRERSRGAVKGQVVRFGAA